jgi:TetR/AcrR family transcriptional regulator of autoinduction and epiphytic fitness
MSAPALIAPEEDGRRRRILEAAIATFLRYGYRKTSMEEVARAADISRQGLYLHFPTKEDLFRAGVSFIFADAVTNAGARLRAADASLEEKLVGAFDEWIGRFVGMIGGDVSDLEAASKHLVGPLIAEGEAAFVADVTRVVRAEGLAGAYRSAGLTAKQLAETLNATARGLKHSCATRAEFVERFSIAVRAMCAPLAG